jgi:ABC-2 type transport system permease protein
VAGGERIVSWPHFQAFLWLRWRLLVNQLRRGGIANIVFLVIIAVAAAGTALVMAVAMFLVGLLAVTDAPPQVLLYVWDGLIAAFLLFWGVGLMVELQRSEALALDKFLHLPVSLRSAFVINYLSSLINPCMVIFLPAMLGLSLGLVLSRGPAWLLVFPLLAAFLLAVTALTYQFQGWLAALMANPRRRRTIIVVATATIILLAQAPNLLVNVFHQFGRDDQAANDSRRIERQNDLLRQLEAKEINSVEFQRRQDEITREHKAQANAKTKEGLEKIENTTRLVNLALPPGWLPFGAMALAEGNVFPALLGTLGLELIGTVSLWRAYRTTLRLYTGQASAGGQPRAATPPLAVPKPSGPATGPSGPQFLDRRLPGLSEQATAIALAGFRGLTRAPEAKMMLLTPVILVVVFGSMALTRPTAPSVALRPFIATGAIAMILLCMGQLIGNQFGFDRAGFRVFVLCAARRSDILLGKNLSFAPLALGLSGAGVVLLQFVCPMRLDLFVATLPQAVSMYLLYCLAANLLSILAPMSIAAGSLRPANSKTVPVLIHLAFTLVLPVVLAPAVLPLGIEYLLEWLGWRSGIPVALLLSLAVCAAVVVVYKMALIWQGNVLHEREQRILEIVTRQVE